MELSKDEGESGERGPGLLEISDVLLRCATDIRNDLCNLFFVGKKLQSASVDRVPALPSRQVAVHHESTVCILVLSPVWAVVMVFGHPFELRISFFLFKLGF